MLSGSGGALYRKPSRRGKLGQNHAIPHRKALKPKRNLARKDRLRPLLRLVPFPQALSAARSAMAPDCPDRCRRRHPRRSDRRPPRHRSRLHVGTGGLVDQYFLAMLAVVARAGARFGRPLLPRHLAGRAHRGRRPRRLFAHLLNLSPGFYERSRSGEVVSRLTADTTQIKSAFSTTASIALAQRRHAGRAPSHDDRHQPEACPASSCSPFR